MSDEQERALRKAAEELADRVRESDEGQVWTMREEDDEFVVEGPYARHAPSMLRRFLHESGHYFVVIGLAVIGVGVYLEVESTSPDKQTFAVLLFLYGAWWIGTALWLVVVKPRLKR